MEGSSCNPTPGKIQENSKISVPAQLANIPPAVESPICRHRWNTNEEIASVLIAFDRHKEWQLRELKIRPPSGSMLLYSRNKVRYRKDGYCWKKRRDGKTIREDHMKLKVQGVECIYGSYVHSAVLPTFHRRCYWLLQNPDIVLVHYLNVPYPDNTKLSIPVLSYDMEKKEWTKEELVDQLRPMLSSSRQGELGPEQDHLIEETMETIVQQLINFQDKHGKTKPHKCGPSCDKNFPHSRCKLSQKANGEGPSGTSSLAHNRLVSMLQRNSHRSATQTVAAQDFNTGPVVIAPSNPHSRSDTEEIQQQNTPLILNLASLQGSNGLIIVSGQNSSPISIINNSLTTSHQTVATSLDNQGRQHLPQIFQTIPQAVGLLKQEDNTSQNIHRHDTSGKTTVPMHVASEILTDLAVTHIDTKCLSGDNLTVTGTDIQRNLQNTLDIFKFGNSSVVGMGSKDNSVNDNCDTLDGSFSSFPSTDLNLDYLLDLPELDDCPDLTAGTISDSGSGLGSSHGQSGAVPLINCASCLSNQRAQQQQPQTLCQEVAAPTQQVEAGLEQSTSSCQTQSEGRNSFGSVAVITDFSPDWSYTEGGTKILVTGPWYATSSSYSCVFDGKSTPATMVQAGVLRCFTPAHDEGLVTLHVVCDGFVASNSEVFEYRLRERQETRDVHAEWFSMDDTKLKMLLIDRLEKLEKRLTAPDKNTPFISKQSHVNEGPEEDERQLIDYTEHLAARHWLNHDTYPKAGHGGMTLLHLAAGLGYAKLVSTFIRWRSDRPSLVLEYEVDAHSVDNHACTPLIWACAKGKIDAALTLYHWNSGPLSICNKDGHLPLTVARQKGHHNLANQIEQLEQARLQSSSAQLCKSDSGFGQTDPILQTEINTAPLFSSQSSFKKDCSDDKTENLSIDIPPPPPYPGDSKLVRRLSEQAIGTTVRQLSKRYSVDILPSGAGCDQTSPKGDSYQRPIREANSEPRLSVVAGQPVQESSLLSLTHRDLTSPDVLMQTDSILNSVAAEAQKETDAVLDHMDTGNVDDGKNQMVTLANQIIAAMPERIKLSPAKEDECEVSRPRSESYSSVPSQGSPHTSSFGDDSGISTPMTDSLAFDEYRYTDLGTPASSLSPDSTCLPSPYSPYSFTLDSPPPTTADFTEYFNAPSTYMEKDFSQLTLSDQEQRKLYEAAKVIQSAYRLYRDKQQQQLQRQKEIEAAILIQSYYRRYKQYAYFKKMTQAAVLIQNQFRSYYAQKRLKKSRDPAPGLQTQYRREPERLKKGRNQSVIIQQRYRSHYQRRTEKEGGRQVSGDATDSSPPPEHSSHSRGTTPPADADSDEAATTADDVSSGQ